MLQIQSSDVASGNTYNGTWNLSNSLNGTLTLANYFIEQVTTDWITSSDYLCVTFTDFGTGSNIIVKITFTAQSSSDPTTIATQFQSDFQNNAVVTFNTTGFLDSDFLGWFDTAGVVWTGTQYQFQITSNTINGTYRHENLTFNFTTNTNVAYLWGSPDITQNYPSGSQTEQNFDLTPTIFIGETLPQYLYFTFNECIGGVTTSNSYKPTLVISTWDVFTGMTINLNGNVNSFNIMISNPNNPSTPYAYNGYWVLVFV